MEETRSEAYRESANYLEGYCSRFLYSYCKLVIVTNLLIEHKTF